MTSVALGVRLGIRLGRALDPLFAAVLAVSQGRPVFTADYYLVDGVSGKVAAFVDWNDPTHLLAQSDAAKQVAVPSLQPDFASRKCAVFTGAQWYVSNRVPNDWAYIHNGTGLEAFCLSKSTATSPTSVLWATARLAQVQTGTDVGAVCFAFSRPVCLNVSNGAARIIDGDPSVGVATTPYYADVKYAESASPKCDLRRNGALSSSPSVTGAPSGSSPQGTLTLGADTAGLNPSRTVWGGLFFFPVLSAGSRAVVQACIQQDYGIAP